MVEKNQEISTSVREMKDQNAALSVKMDEAKERIGDTCAMISILFEARPEPLPTDRVSGKY